MTLLLMAAGRGSRYGKLKQFDDLGPAGEFLMEFSIYDALQNGFDHIVVITQQSNVEFLREHLEDRLPAEVQLDVLAQELSDLPQGLSYEGDRPKPWGTAHAVWTARGVIDTSFVVINADDYYGQKAYKHAAEFIQNSESEHPFALVAYTLRDTLSEHGSVSRGVCEREGDQLKTVVERTKLLQKENTVIDQESGLSFTGEELVSMNYWVCDPLIFEYITEAIEHYFESAKDLERGEVYLPFVIQDMLQSGEIDVQVLATDSKWFGVTYSEDRDIAVNALKEMTRSGAYPTPLWESS